MKRYEVLSLGIFPILKTSNRKKAKKKAKSTYYNMWGKKCKNYYQIYDNLQKRWL